MSKPRDIEVLEALFVGDDVERDDVVRVAEAAAHDPELRDLYDRLAVTDEELGGEFENAFGEALFSNALDEMLAAEQDEAERDETESPDNVVVLAERARRPTGAWLAAAALVAMALGAVASDSLRRSSPEFQARSAVVAEKPTEYEKPRLEVFCVERNDGQLEFTGQRESEFGTVRCPLDAEIKIGVESSDPELRHAAFFGIGPDSTLYWYGPSPAAPGSVTIEPSEDVQSVGETIRLEVNHSPGTVRVLGLFSEGPLEWSTVRHWIGRHSVQLRNGYPALRGGTVVRQTFEVTQP